MKRVHLTIFCLNLNSFNFIRVQVRVQKNSFFKFEFGKLFEIFRVQVRILSSEIRKRLRTASLNLKLLVFIKRLYIFHLFSVFLLDDYSINHQFSFDPFFPR